MNKLSQKLWIITPHETLAKELRKSYHANEIINISTFLKKFYRNILKGNKLILSKKQQYFLINKFSNNRSIDTLLEIWQKHQEEPSNNLETELKKYQNHLSENSLTDENQLWKAIIDELKPSGIKFVFWGFCHFKANTEQLIKELSLYHTCQFHYPISLNKKIQVFEHVSENQELTWLQTNTKENCVIICPDSSKFLQISSIIPTNTAKSTNLACTTIASNALLLIQEIINLEQKLAKSKWLKILQLRFPGNKDLNKWQANSNSVIMLKDMKKQFGADIADWLNNLISYKSKMNQKNTFAAWGKIFNDLLELANWPFINYLTEENIKIIDFWHDNLKSWSSQDYSNTELVSGKYAISSLIKDCTRTKFKTTINPKSNIKLLTPNEAVGINSDNLIIINANSKFSQDQETAEQTFKRLVSQAQNIYFSYASTVKSEPCQIFPPLLGYSKTSWQAPLGQSIKFNSRSEQEYIKHQKCQKITSRMLSEQAQCPIKTVLGSRLNIPVDQNSEINLLRGIVCHEVLAWFWQEIRSQAQLLKLSREAINEKVCSLLKKSLHKHSKLYETTSNKLTSEIEQEYLQKLILQQLEIEKTKGAFEVVEIESERNIMVGDYAIKVRLDRVDLDEHGLHLIDYKTGNVSPSNWLGNPPKDPQIPLYLIERAYSNVSYACLNKNLVGFKGFDNIRKVSWDDFIANCNSAIKQLISEIAEGVSYKKPVDPSLCDTCYFAVICRKK